MSFRYIYPSLRTLYSKIETDLPIMVGLYAVGFLLVDATIVKQIMSTMTSRFPLVMTLDCSFQYCRNCNRVVTITVKNWCIKCLSQI